MDGFHHVALVPRIFWAETAEVHQRDIFPNFASSAGKNSKRMGDMQPPGQGASYLGMQNVLKNAAKPGKIILSQEIQIKIGHETISYVWIYWVNGRPLHK